MTTVLSYEVPLDKNFGTPKAGVSLNAVKVIVSQNVISFFGLAPQSVVVQALATQAQPVTAFSLGTGLLSVCSGASPLLAPLVNGLLGSNVCLSAPTYNGLVGAQVSLLDLLANLNVNAGSIDQVLNAQVSLAQLVNASVQALSPAQVANINVADLLSLTTGSLGGSLLKIGDILNLNAAAGVSALSAQINVLDLLNVGTLQVANKHNFLDLGTNVDLGPLGKVGLKLSLIEAPQMAVGGIGAVATSAQMRLALNVNLLLGLVHLPLYIDLAPGKATLTSVHCNAPQSATFNIQTGLAEICLANSQTDSSGPLSCPDVSQWGNQVNVLPLVSLGINASLTNPPTPVTLSAPLPSSVTVGAPLSSILGGIVKSENLFFGGILALLNPLVGILGALLNPILSAVGGLLDAVLSLLGIGIGQSTLKLSSISCGAVKLVY